MSKKIFTAIIALMGLCATVIAQEQKLQVMKNGTVVFETAATGSEKIVFQNPSGTATPPSDEALVVQQKSGSPVTTLLDNIREITFSGGNMSVVPHSGAAAVYPMGNIVKLSFTGTPTANEHLTANNQLTAWFNPSGNVVVQCEAGILSASLISIQGSIMAREKGNAEITTLEMRTGSSLAAGIYILRAETTKGTLVKKLVNTKR